MNHYEVTSGLPSTGARRIQRMEIGLIVVTGLLALAVAVGVIELFIPRVRSFTAPRFGGMLVMCLNPIIFLISAIRNPTRSNLIAAGLMTMTIGFVNAVVLCQFGTVSTIQNEFTQRLHSSWLWAVVPFFVAGGYLLWSAVNSPSALGTRKGDEP